MAANKHPSSYYIKTAEKNHLRVEPADGSHTKVYGPAGRGYQIIPKGKDLSPGVECKIRKWFLKLGILVTLALTIYLAAGNLL